MFIMCCTIYIGIILVIYHFLDIRTGNEKSVFVDFCITVYYEKFKKFKILFLLYFNQINAALVSRRDFFQKHKKKKILPTPKGSVSVNVQNVFWAYNTQIMSHYIWSVTHSFLIVNPPFVIFLNHHLYPSLPVASLQNNRL